MPKRPLRGRPSSHHLIFDLAPMQRSFVLLREAPCEITAHSQPVNFALRNLTTPPSNILRSCNIYRSQEHLLSSISAGSHSSNKTGPFRHFLRTLGYLLNIYGFIWVMKYKLQRNPLSGMQCSAFGPDRPSSLAHVHPPKLSLLGSVSAIQRGRGIPTSSRLIPILSIISFPAFRGITG
ncbi:hypothetical protein SISSUDRAFT_1031012 [Sistotremastrum suecicum HHB10207 ss-3]|uniref:Uncharacterized protein n=1 Tax=Sistotremastrum suecicum HHB10207 ss-3 TaxID=1314776 RepID=A0A166GGI1_9AGAM|nr:hypothetical protein SISSUDRAFT_1031012 [Sistotremastrum suecicum HHB10207 ss-3]